MRIRKFLNGIGIGICLLALAGCGASENGTSPNTENGSIHAPHSNGADQEAANSKEDPTISGTGDEEKLDNMDGDSLILSSDLRGSVIEFAKDGCTVSPVTNEGEHTAIVAAPGSESEESSVTVSYQTDCTFQKATIDLTTGKVTFNDVSVSSIKKQTSLLIYGEFKDSNHLTATKIIILQFEREG
ncbi:MAG: hypothetical protein HFI63_00305 [Lachnospiraceae bacterium]|nr:hypothetical protein [Lachnospiraceae bacterium]